MYTKIVDQPWFILVAIIVLFAVIGTVAFLIRKFVINKNEPKEKVEVDEAAIREENLKRVLEPIEDEESLKAMEQYEETNSKEQK